MNGATIVTTQAQTVWVGGERLIVIPGKLDTEAISKAIKPGNGKAELNAAIGGTLWHYERT